MTKTEAIKLFGNAAKLAGALGITRSAVSQWEASKSIPKEHELRIRYELQPAAANHQPKRKKAA